MLITCLDVSFISYIVSEVTHGYQLKEDKDLFSEKQRRITTFMKTPRELEKVRAVHILKTAGYVRMTSTCSLQLMLFGFFICLDAFLFLFTFLPLRLLVAVVSLLYRFLTCSM